MRDDGSLNGPLNAGAAASDMVVATEFPQLVGANKLQRGYSCSPAPSCALQKGFAPPCSEQCRIYDYSYLLHFTALYTAASTTIFTFNSDAQPAVQSDGRDVLVAWFVQSQIADGEVVAARLTPASFTDFSRVAAQARPIGSFSRSAGLTRPDIATDGKRYFVVWRTMISVDDHDILGASIDRDGKVTPLSIAASPADEREPSVVAVGDGRFLVAYETFRGGERRIAGRFVTFGARRRVVGH
jgi:hypothetical protein